MAEEKTLRLYQQYNPWWTTGKVPGKFHFPYKRFLFRQLKRAVKDQKSVILVGPRRAGKTVLLYQLIENLLNQGVDPQKIFYLACDDPSLAIAEHPVADAIDFFEKIIYQQSLLKKQGRFYLIFDEIQGLPKWAEYFKKYADLGYPVRFLASGSSSIKMIKTTKESLVGRGVEIQVLPFSFSEFLQLTNENVFKEKQRPLINIFKRNELEKEARILYKKGIKRIEVLENSLQKYLVFGGFPETYGMSFQEANSYLKTQVIERVIFRDIPRVVEIRNPELLRQLLIFLSNETANVVSFSNLCSKLASRYETISSYLFYLESSFLINILKKYSRGGLARAKTWPKIHIGDPAIVNAMLNLEKEILSKPELLGRVTEGMVANFLRSKQGFNSFYWRERDKEVDLILERGGRVLPIEVKNKSRVQKKELKALFSFQEKFKSKWSLLITKDQFEIENNLIKIPLWLFLLLRF